MTAESSSRGVVVKTGEILDGRYRIVRTLGAGWMGTVYLAEHVDLKRRFALKILRPELRADPQALEGFITEARAAGSLGHPHIVECSDAGVTTEQAPYLALEYLEGAVLTDEIYRLGGLPVRRALRIAGQIASALGAAHDAGIVHRDLTSDNVFLVDHGDARDVVKVLDFGIARLFAAEDDCVRRGGGMGTPEFMAPEQLTRPAAADRRCDVYALGVILYEMLTARRPISDDDRRSLVHRVIHQAPPPLMRPDAPPGLEAMIVGKLLAKDPAQRHGSMAEVQRALDGFATASRPSGPLAAELEPDPRSESAPPRETAPRSAPADPVALPPRPRATAPALAWLLGAVLAAGAAGGAGYLERQQRVASERAVIATLEADAEKLASLLDAEVRAAHLRADAIAAMPMLRAAIETDAATLKDMVGSDFILSPRAGEVLELFQLRGPGQGGSLLRIPADGAPISPVAGNQIRIASDGRRITIVAGAPVARQRAGIGGAVAIATPFDLSPITRRIAGHARSATLVGLGPPLALVGTGSGGPAITIPVPLGPDLGTGAVAIAAVVVAPGARSELGIARLSCWGLSGALLALFTASLLRNRKQE